MKIKQFVADNNRFGVVLSEVMKNHHVSGSDLMFYAEMHKENVSQSKGKGDYRLSVYVRIVSALRYFIEDSAEYARVKQRLIEAAFMMVTFIINNTFELVF